MQSRQVSNRPRRVVPLRLALLIAGLIAACGGARNEGAHSGPPPPTTTHDDGAPGFPMGEASAAISCSIERGEFCTAGCEVRCPGKQRAICTSGVSECNAVTGCSCKHESTCRCQLL
jgi:hypothetical protein